MLPLILASILLAAIFAFLLFILTTRTFRLHKAIDERLTVFEQQIHDAPPRVYEGLLRTTSRQTPNRISTVEEAHQLVAGQRFAVFILNGALEQIVSSDRENVLAGCDRIRALGDERFIEDLEEIRGRWGDHIVQRHLDATRDELETYIEQHNRL